MKIKTVQALNAYNLLKTVKVASMSNETAVKVWKAIKSFRPIAEEYKKSQEEAIETLKDEKFDEMQMRVQKAREREERVNKEGYVLTDDEKRDVAEINKYFAEFNEKGNEYFNELADKEVDVEPEKIEVSDLLKGLKESNSSFQDMEELDFMIC